MPWYSEASTGDCELRNAYVLVSDIEGLTASDIGPIREQCRQAGRPLVLVTPGVDRSIFPLVDEGDLLAIHASELPGQPLRGLLVDVAVIAGANVLCQELGFGLHFPPALSQLAQQGICVPDLSWKDVRLDSLARVDRILVNREGLEFRWAKMSRGQQRNVQAYTAAILREAPTSGRDERLRRLCTAAGCLPDKAQALAVRPTDFSPDYPLGLASLYFITDPSARECLLDDARVAVFSEPLDDLELLVGLLGRAATDGRPLLLLAPMVSDEALAICVVNKLRGIIQCAVVVPRTPSPETAGLLADIARRTGARVVGRADGDRLPDQGSLGRATTVRATCEGLVLSS
jgi:hypothetical protein